MTRPSTAGATPRAVLFDFYNTLGTAVDPEAGRLRSELDRFGHSFPSETLTAAMRRAWLPYDGPDPVDHREHSGSAERYLAWRSQIELAWLRELGLDPCPTELLDAVCAVNDDPAGFRVFEDVSPALHVLRRRGYALGVVSNWGWELQAIFEREGIAEFLDVIVASARCGYRKPHPEIYRHALRQLGLGPQEVLFVGDNPHADLAGPRSIGMPALLIDRFRSACHEEPDRIGSLEELLDRLPEAGTS